MLYLVLAIVFFLSLCLSFSFGYFVSRDIQLMLNRQGETKPEAPTNNDVPINEEEHKKAELSKKYKDNFYSYDGTAQE